MKKLSPKNAKGTDNVLRLRRDNASSGNFWILTDGEQVTICHQKPGDSPKASITIPRTEFNRLVDFYTREQTVSS